MIRQCSLIFFAILFLTYCTDASSSRDLRHQQLNSMTNSDILQLITVEERYRNLPFVPQSAMTSSDIELFFRDINNLYMNVLAPKILLVKNNSRAATQAVNEINDINFEYKHHHHHYNHNELTALTLQTADLLTRHKTTLQTALINKNSHA